MKLYMAAILAISFLDIFNEGIVRGSFGSQVMPENRCTDLYTEEIDIKRIASYENHERPFKAVIFITNRGFRICVQHDLPWVQNAIQKLDQKPKPRPHKKPKPSSRRRAISTSRPKARTS
ncbi:PREDICTED: lymphotactin-like [Gekko japonicus]|uniref:Lymphotactin-like n=1 Tax=Gekko japonicus TaxID=146911 RepID=A0ABM1LCN5_GEKJA|nr:PREDICTED: lymphotactin-like [Gekko japonicus]